MNKLLIASSILLLSACSQTGPQPTSKSSSSSPAEQTQSPAFEAHSQGVTLRGQLIIGHETRSFQPCGSNQQFWVVMEPKLTQQIEQLAREPYQPLYAELIGELAPASQTGFGADFPAQLNVSQLNFVTAENPNRCEQPQREARAIGNEPNWIMSPTPSSVTYQRMGQEKQQFAVSSSTISEAKQVYRFDNGSLELLTQLCSDGMSDSLYGWYATAVIGSDRLKGCATMSNADSSLVWQGEYAAQSTKNLGFTISVNLNSDHTAVTRYDYADGSNSTRELGYWQALSDSEVEVVSTVHQGQRLVAKRVYTQQGEQLVATKETVNGTDYPLQDGGIVLFKVP